MNIDDLTIGQAKQLAALFGSVKQEGEWVTPHIGKRCIIRTYASGVFCAEVAAHSGRIPQARKGAGMNAEEEMETFAGVANAFQSLLSAVDAAAARNGKFRADYEKIALFLQDLFNDDIGPILTAIAAQEEWAAPIGGEYDDEKAAYLAGAGVKFGGVR